MVKKPAITIILIQLTAWLLFFGFVLTFVSHMNQDQDIAVLLKTEEFWFFAATYLSVFYLNSIILFPHLYLQKKYVLYFLIFAALFVGVILLRPFDNLMHNFSMLQSGPKLSFGEAITNNNEIGSAPIKQGPKIDILSIVMFVLVWSVGSAFQSIRQWQSAQEKAARAEAEKAKAELAFLKAQINPHFLFNTLNNIYSLAISKSDNTADAIMKLSNIMRYVTDEVTQDYVPLADEIKCINDYIELQRLRLSKKVAIRYSVEGNVEDKQIAPLVLIPFVENVFKYGISSHEPSEIVMTVKAGENSIDFFCQNKIFNTENKLDRIGIGVENTRKRLELVYDGRQSLSINTDNGLFMVQLNIQV